MPVRITRTFTFAAVLLVALVGHAAELGEKEQDIARILASAHFPEMIRLGFQVAIERSPESLGAGRLRKVMAMSDNQLIAAAVPAFFDVFTAEEARQVADFWASDTIAAMTKLQIAGDPAPLEKLTPQQRAEFIRFTQSSGGAASQRMAARWKDEKFMDQLGIQLIGASEAARIFGEQPKKP
jgi:hypothetical protein